MTPLSDLIGRRMRELGVTSVRELARRAERFPGGSLDHSTIAGYLRGTETSPTERTIACLAFVLEVDVTTVAAATRSPTQHAPFVLPPEAAQLTPRQRRAVVELVRSMAETCSDPSLRQ